MISNFLYVYYNTIKFTYRENKREGRIGRGGERAREKEREKEEEREGVGKEGKKGKQRKNNEL